jgi:hypothetical protein
MKVKGIKQKEYEKIMSGSRGCRSAHDQLRGVYQHDCRFSHRISRDFFYRLADSEAAQTA